MFRTRSAGTPLWLAVIAAAGLLLPGAAGAQETTGGYDVLIAGGEVMDGTGSPAFRADVAIRGGRIVEIGELDASRAERVIDARGKVVTPGFIDLHSHADDGAGPEGGLRDRNPRRWAAPNLVAQGVTTVVVNHDGRSPWPIRRQREQLERQGTGVNTILLVGHGSVRRKVMGSDHRRPATEAEVQRMRRLVRQGMEEGAYGLSAGLEYAPGRWSTTDEVAALVAEIVPFGGVYISHERSEGQDPLWYVPSQHPDDPPTLLDAVRETIDIGERTGATVIASHIKAKGESYWGRAAAAIQLIEEARERGVDVWADQYPYATSGTDGNAVLIPRWALAPEPSGGEGGFRRDHAAALRRVLEDSASAERLRRDVEHEISRRGGAENVVVFEYPHFELVGKSLAKIAAERRLSVVEAAIRLQLEGDPTYPGGGRVRGFSMSERDIEVFAARPWVATASDAGIALPEDGPAVHARYYGTFPRKIRRYALERGTLTLEEAIRSMTSLPAQILGISDRGAVRVGMAADLVVLDLEKIRDRATFRSPHQYPEGIEHVLVNGHPVLERGAHTWQLPGVVIGSSRAAAVGGEATR